MITNDRTLKRQLRSVAVAVGDDGNGGDDDGEPPQPLPPHKIPPSVLRSRWLLRTSGVVRPCHSSHASCGQQLRSLLETWTDYFLLASADALLLDRSGFSMTAASVGFVPPRSRLFGAECAFCVGARPYQLCANVSYNHNA